MVDADAFWITRPGHGEIRHETLPLPAEDDVVVRTRFSAVSRGTESLVFAGRVPPGERERMRAPFQEGDLPGPVKYGYLNVGVVLSGPAALRGRSVFALRPHQTAYVGRATDVLPLPDGVPERRAVLAGTVETALNALWDAAPRLGDRACVVGAGMVGCCVARLLARIPAVEVTLVDVDPSRAAIAEALGVGFAVPDRARGPYEIVIHASATEAGLRRCLELVRPDGEVLELSWYGTTEVTLPLGGAFHSGRLAVRASQVGEVAAARRGARSRRDRLTLALDLLDDPAFDVLLEGPTPFRRLPDLMPRLTTSPGLCHVISYEEE